ncbi:MAG TPA: type II toxin-antitoxin system RelE/ParE family toxin [Candidatus Sulfotelmatobacter sp.]|nr:type II toxin-antitoxin system RelE/ParE family toxin [Candidatus Sulfotelmatobacter sp.]
MTALKSAEFLADIERQYEWYALKANLEIAERYLDAVQATVRLIELHPQIGPIGTFVHKRLKGWRYFVVFRPFNKHVLFYEIVGDNIILRRAMHGHRNLPRRLLES